jgi:hypothetical protein
MAAGYASFNQPRRIKPMNLKKTLVAATLCLAFALLRAEAA